MIDAGATHNETAQACKRPGAGCGQAAHDARAAAARGASPSWAPRIAAAAAVLCAALLLAAWWRRARGRRL